MSRRGALATGARRWPRSVRVDWRTYEDACVRDRRPCGPTSHCTLFIRCPLHVAGAERRGVSGVLYEDASADFGGVQGHPKYFLLRPGRAEKLAASRRWI